MNARNLLRAWPKCAVGSPERRLLVAIAARIAETALQYTREQDRPALRNCLDVCLRYVHGEATFDEVRTARESAWETWRDATTTAVSDAAYAYAARSAAAAAVSAAAAYADAYAAADAADAARSAADAREAAEERHLSIVLAHVPAVDAVTVTAQARRIGDLRWEFLTGASGRLEPQTADVLCDRSLERIRPGDWRRAHRAGRAAARWAAA